jgi:CPA2 family monovalent cation:H+ antiporter-2
MFIGAARGDAALAFIEIGAVALGLSVLARVASRLGITAIPLYLLAGLAVGEGGVAPLDVSADFIHLAGEIGVLLLLLTLGLEYSPDELRQGLHSGARPGAVDAAVNFVPGFGVGMILGWEPATAALLGGVCWVTSSGVVSKVLTDLDRLGNRETPAVLNLLVIEDLAMALYLPVVGAVVAGTGAGDTAVTVAIALAAVSVILTVALRWGDHISALLAPASDESLLLAVFGLTVLVGGLAQKVQVSAAIGAFLVGLALSGSVRARAAAVISPLRDLFAATFFLFFSFSIPAQRSRRGSGAGHPPRSLRDRRQAVLGLGRRVRSQRERAVASEPGPRSSRAASFRSSSPRSERQPPTVPISVRWPRPMS